MTQADRCDLHCHYIPAVDDGVRTLEQGRALCRGLRQLGYATVIATPHIRPGMFDNHKPALRAAFDAFVLDTAGDAQMPATGLAAEHFCDDTFFVLLERGDALPYPGGHAALVEFPPERMPIGLPDQGEREADSLARKRIGRLGASVFMVPTRTALAAGCWMLTLTNVLIFSFTIK